MLRGFFFTNPLAIGPAQLACADAADEFVAEALETVLRQGLCTFLNFFLQGAPRVEGYFQNTFAAEVRFVMFNEEPADNLKTLVVVSGCDNGFRNISQNFSLFLGAF